MCRTTNTGAGKSAGSRLTTSLRVSTAADKTRLLARRNANDPSWQALKARADTLATYRILPFKSASRNDAPDGTIFYTYQGEGWLGAAIPLAFAYQMTSDTKYSGKLI